MAQTNYTPIQLYYSTTAAAVPVNTNLANGELAINITDGKLYYKDNGGTVRLLASNATSAPVLSFQTSLSGLTPSTATTGVVTLAGTLGTSSGGTNLTSFTSGGAMYATSTSALTTGTLPTTAGGTALTSFTSGGVVYASSSSALATGSALTFDGTQFGVSGNVKISNTANPYLQLFDGTRSGYIQMASGALNLIQTTAQPITFSTNNTERLVIDSAGNLGLGVTPSAWYSTGYSALQVKGSSIYAQAGNDTNLASNAFVNTSPAWAYIATGTATRYEQTSGKHVWYNAASGTAGNAITFTQAMTLEGTDRTNLLVGTTSSLSGQAGRTDLSVNGSSTAIVSLGVAGARQGYFYTPGTGVIIASENGALALTTTSGQIIRFDTNNTERAQIDSVGTFIIKNDYKEQTYTANSSTAITLNITTNGTDQVITLTGTATITMPTATAGKSFLLKLKTGAGGYTVTWTTVKWPGGTAPTLTSTASRMDIFSFFSDGTNWYGTTVGQNYTP